LASRNSSPRKQNTKKTTAHTIAQVGMFSRVTDRSANWNVVCPIGAEPLGVTTVVWPTPTSPIVTRVGSAGWPYHGRGSDTGPA
jgi:hypothetical protein